jgi:hypothetical protein
MYDVRIGNRLEVKSVKGVDVDEVVKLAEVAESDRKARMQERLAYLILGALTLALFIATGIGFVDGSYNEVNYVWSAAALPLGYVLKTYFEPRSKG